MATNGNLLEPRGNSYLYRFTLEDLWETQDGVHVKVRVPQASSEIEATLVAAKGTFVLIETNELLPESALKRIELSDDPIGLLRKLRETLETIDEGSSQLASKAFGLLKAVTNRPSFPVALGSFMPDPSQKRAFSLAQTNEVSYIIGPPGTGKTYTLAAIALAHLHEGHSILIAAHTNIAVDNAIMKLCDLCHETGNVLPLEQGRIVRYGVPQLKRLREDDTYKDIYLPKLVEQRGQTLSKQLHELKQSLGNILRSIEQAEQEKLQRKKIWQIERTRLEQQLEHTQQEWSLVTQLCEKRQKLMQLEDLVVRQKTDLKQSEERATTSERRLAEAQQMKAFLRFLRKMNLAQLQEQLVTDNHEVWNIKQALASKEKALAEAHADYARTAQLFMHFSQRHHGVSIHSQTPGSEVSRMNDLKSARESYHRSLAAGEVQYKRHVQDCSRCIQTLVEDRQRIAEQIAVIDEQLARIERDIVEQACVITTTLSQIYMSQVIAERRFDIVILDEVSMASLPTVYCAVSHANYATVLIGDPRQLAPIIQSKETVAKEWLGTDLFTHCGIELEQVAKDDNTSKRMCSMLNQQSRMHSRISAIARQYIYKGYLFDSERVHDPRRKNYENLAPNPGNALVLCNTSDGSPIATMPEGGSRINIYHAHCVMALLQQVLLSLPSLDLQENDEPPIGLITPYKKQARLLKRLVKEAGLEKFARIGTVHSFQGLEFDTVIFDTVESQEIEPARGFITGIEGVRLINVAVTRARHKLIIVANEAYLKRKLSPSEILLQAINAAKAASIISSQAVCAHPFPLTEKSLAGAIGTPEISIQQILSQSPFEFKMLTQDNFFPAFTADVKAACASVDICCPFLTPSKATQELICLLDQKCREHVQVRAYIRPPRENRGREVEKSLQEAGVRIYKYKRDKMHEKIVIIDRKIVYLGSLNILAHGQSTDVMLRVISPILADEIQQCFLRGSSVMAYSR